jgi:hypothetical protein
VFAVGGCVSTSAPPRAGVVVPSEDLPFLVEPTLGYAPALNVTERRSLIEGVRAVRAGDVTAALATANGLKESASAPAAVLQAEAELLRGRADTAVEELAPVVEAMPDYAAARIVLGRVRERLGDLVPAYRQYVAVADSFSPAARRAAELRPRVVEILGHRVTSALESGQLSAAASALDDLQAWAPAEEETLRAALAVAQAQQKPRAELEALRGLVKRHPQDEDLARRRANLELHWGDPTVGFQTLQDLSAAHPGDMKLANEAAGARYYWRLAMLPTRVRELTERPQLTRGEYAGLLYWLMPSVRSQQGVSKIASDVLDSPWRTEIIRIVNLGLMSIDTSQHRFEPERDVTQREALLALLRLIDRHVPRPACLGGQRFAGVSDADAVCNTAAACGLVASAGGCVPTAPVTGQEAVEYAHRAQQGAGGS